MKIYAIMFAGLLLAVWFYNNTLVYQGRFITGAVLMIMLIIAVIKGAFDI